MAMADRMQELWQAEAEAEGPRSEGGIRKIRFRLTYVPVRTNIIHTAATTSFRPRTCQRLLAAVPVYVATVDLEIFYMY